MRPPVSSEIAIAPGEGTSAYERARRQLHLGEFATSAAAVGAKFIVHMPAKAVRDPSAVSAQVLSDSLLYRRKKYSEE